MTRLTTLPALRLAGVLVLPPAVGLAVSAALWRWGGQRACFASLDVSTPGLSCATSLTLLTDAMLLGAVQLLAGLPLAFRAARKPAAARSLLLGTVLVVAALAAAWSWVRVRVGGVTLAAAAWESAGELGIPVLATLAAAILLGRRSGRPRPAARHSGSALVPPRE